MGNEKENDSNLFEILYLFKDNIFIEKLDENYKQIIYEELYKFEQMQIPTTTNLEQIQIITTPTTTNLEQTQIPTTTNLEQTQITIIPTTTNLEQTQITTIPTTTTPTFLRTLGEIFYNNINYELALLEINNFFENIGELEIKDNKSEEIYYNGVNLRDMNINDIIEELNNENIDDSI